MIRSAGNHAIAIVGGPKSLQDLHNIFIEG